jgi:hypothetical protein
MKRLLFFGADDPLKIDVLNRLIEEHKLDFVCNVTSAPSHDIKKNGITYHEVDFWKACYGQYDQVDSVLGPKVLDSLSPYLLVTLKMMDRLKYEKTYRFDDRLEMYLNHVKYWSYVLDTFKVDCFLSWGMPHEICNYIIYTLCKARGIKTVVLKQARDTGYVQLLEDIDENDTRLMDNGNIGSLQRPFSPYMKEYFERMTTQYSWPVFMKTYLKKLDQRLSLPERVKGSFKQNWLRLVKAKKYLNYDLKDFSFFLYSYARCSPSVDIKLRNFYNSISCLPDLSKKYIYVPLHCQPENSTSPMGGIFVFQDLMIEMLANSLPEGVFLYVKENPMQEVFGRSEDFYKKFIGNPRVVWIRKDAPSFDLIKNAVTVATVSGTSLWEALFQKKKVIMFGTAFFKYAPGVFQVSELDECKEAIREILRTGDMADLDGLRNFLVRFEQSSIRGWIEPLFEKTTGISYQENVDNIVAGLRNI